METQKPYEPSEAESRRPLYGNGLQRSGPHRVLVLNFMGNKGGCAVSDGVMFTLNRMHGSDVHVVGYEE